MKTTKTIQFIEKRNRPLLLVFFISLAGLAIVLKKPTLVSSVVLGMGFSYLSFSNQLRTNRAILDQKNHQGFFKSFVFRLLLQAVPIAIALRWNTYFNLPIILLSLFSFQGSFVILEGIRNIRHYKNRQKKWKN